MDDSVIKVLRRNGSWKEAKDKTTSEKGTVENKMIENDFILDEKFGVLAEEIKKRMEEKTSLKEDKIQNNQNAKNFDFSKSSEMEEKFNKLKKQLLPHLTEVEQLVHEREIYLKKIYSVDNKLDNIKNEILLVKEKYQKDLESMKKNIDFFNDSLKVIDSIKGRS